MAINLGEAYVDIVPSTGNLAKKTREQLEGPLQESGQRAGRGFGDRFSSALSGFVGSVGRTISSALSGAATLAGGTLATALWQGYSRVTTIQDATAALTVSLGDASKAASLLDDVLGVVRGTPFNLDQFAAAAQQLVGFGVDAQKVPGYLTAIGEASATQGRRANEFADRLSTVFGQVAASGQMSLADVWRISDAGVNALAILANHFGLSRDAMKDMISKGAVPAGEALDALAKGILEGSDGPAGATDALTGMMERLRETLGGSAGGFRAAMARLGESIIAPFTGALTVGFTAASGVLDELGSAIGAWASGLSDTDGFRGFVELMESIPQRVGPAIDRLREIGPALAPLGAAFAAMGLGGLSGALGPLGKLIPTINPLVAALAGLVAVSPELREVFLGVMSDLAPILAEVGDTIMGALADVLPQLVPPLADLAEAFGRILVAAAPALPMLAELAVLLIETIGVPLLTAFAEGIGIVADGLEAMGPVFPIIIAGLVGFKVAMAALTAVMAVNPIVLLAGAIAALAIGLVWAYQNVDWFREAVQAVGRFLVRAAGWVADFGKALWNAGAAVVEFLKDLPGTIARIGGGVLDWFKALPGRVISALGDFAATVGDWFVSGLRALPGAIGHAAGTLVGTFVSIPFQILDALWGLGNWLWDEWLWPALSALPGLIEDGFQAVVEFFKALPGRLVDAIGDFGQFVWTKIFVPAFNFFVQELPRIVVGVLDWFKALPGRIVEAIGEVGGWLVEKGKGLLAGFLNGVKEMALTVWGWLTWLPVRILSFFSNVGWWLYQSGRDLIQGFINGIVSKLHGPLGLFARISDSMGLVKDAARDPLESRSPSRWFMRLGEDAMEGFIIGVASMDAQVKQSLDLAVATLPTVPAVSAPVSQPQPVPVLLNVQGGDGELVRLIQKWVRTNGGGNVQVLSGR